MPCYYAALRRALDTSRSTWSWTFVIVLGIYLMTAHWQSGQVNDAKAAIWPAWQLVQAGTFDLHGAPGLPNNPWFGVVDGRTVSFRTMGVILAGIPFALVTVPFGLDPEQTSALAGATYTAAAIATMHLVFRAVADMTWALLATTALAVGTPLWTTAAAELWAHGPDALFLSLALLALAHNRFVLAGAAFAPAIMVRPHLAAAAACSGLLMAWARRQPIVVLQVGVPASLALPVLYAWNGWYYGAANLGGAYQGHVGPALAAPRGDNSWLFVQDAAGALLSPSVGLLLFSPLVALLLVLIPRGWAGAPPWARASLVAAFAYQIVQLRVNRFHGGGAFYSNRLIVEFIVLSSPVWLVGLQAWVGRTGRRRTVAAALAAIGVGIHAYGAVSGYYLRGSAGDWWIWYPKVVFDAAGPAGWPTMFTLLLIPVVAVLVVRRTTGAESTAWPPAVPADRSSARPGGPPGTAASSRH